MTDTIPSLWPTEFKLDVQTPYTILKVQANQLMLVTRSILNGDVETERSKDKVQHRLVVIAPAYNNYRHTLLVALHDPLLPYPAEVRAEALERKIKRDDDDLVLEPEDITYKTVYPIANSDEQMQELVSKALQSEQTKAVIQSLIAMSRDKL